MESEVDFVHCNQIAKRPVTKLEKSLAKDLSDIYEIAHVFGSTCKHPDWKEKAETLFKELKRQKEV